MWRHAQPKKQRMEYTGPSTSAEDQKAQMLKQVEKQKWLKKLFMETDQAQKTLENEEFAAMM